MLLFSKHKIKTLGLLIGVFILPLFCQAETLNLYPYISNSIYVSNATWSNAHDATSGNVRTLTELLSYGSTRTGYVVERGFLSFLPINLPENATLETSTLTLFNITKSGSGDEQYAIYDSSHSNLLVSGDFDLIGSNILTDKITHNSLTSGTNLTFTFNETGLEYLKNSTSTNLKLSLRETEFDVSNNAPAGTDTGYFSYVSKSGYYPPLLTINYSLPTINTSNEFMSTSTDQVFQQFLLYSQYFLDLIIIGILAFLIFKFITYGRN